MKYISLAQALIIHDDIIEKIGGLSGFHKEGIGLLQSALEHVKNDAFYPQMSDKLAHLMFACIKFHPFCDGNKRTAIYMGMHFLSLNGENIEGFAEYMEDKVVEVANSTLNKAQLRAYCEFFIGGKSNGTF
ncbi:type II toxin-antitoxin system death-on-curing family toxin [Helicobacter jaachi]|uniref:Type II toxin-antitoxin system death-on-curing family toxin n=1 Tax=Helicobacter jaachi TaxID=1677920 RepID=A0A4U8T602_9HELI|nr:type II toxin-antitoxin system death-on-curing family toxin [Helicobacter jaachi]TLD94924.1 type II toxin-antitoxin system death-on-curing family toxin [Helicobacter jaachi]